MKHIMRDKSVIALVRDDYVTKSPRRVWIFAIKNPAWTTTADN
jgi:hypothetical protein